MTNTSVSPERLADDFVSALFDEYQGSRHVRRVASWIGFVVKGVDKVASGTLRREQKWQIMFDYKERQFKVKYNHKTGSRGGLDIVEVLPGRGAPEGGMVVQVTNLSEAEDCYLGLKWLLDSFIKHNSA
ncbi:MAG TPA: hypothetical protein VGJ37_03235 [Pyrinomonadaceae bacterium]|jgi:hypothetical protein